MGSLRVPEFKRLEAREIGSLSFWGYRDVEFRCP